MREQDAEVVALDVFNRADGQPITMSMVQRRLGELLDRAGVAEGRFGVTGTDDALS